MTTKRYAPKPEGLDPETQRGYISKPVGVPERSISDVGEQQATYQITSADATALLTAPCLSCIVAPWTSSDYQRAPLSVVDTSPAEPGGRFR